METRTYKVFKFDELSEDGKKKALERLYDINVDHDWWDYTYADAACVGLEISAFDTDRGSFVDGKLTMSVDGSVQAILKNHGPTCETYKLAKEWEGFPTKEEADSGELEEREEEYRRALCEEYLSILRKEYEYLTSEEAIIETIKANDYDFTEDGKID